MGLGCEVLLGESQVMMDSVWVDIDARIGDTCLRVILTSAIPFVGDTAATPKEAF